MTFPQDSADLAEGGRMPLLGFGTWQIKGSKATSAVGWALDGVRLGYTVEVPLAFTRFVELTAGDTDRSVQEMRSAGVAVG